MKFFIHDTQLSCLMVYYKNRKEKIMKLDRQIEISMLLQGKES